MSGFDDFAPYLNKCGNFIVKNISPQIKTINIFTYPINYGYERNLLLIPGVAEDDIRASLLKGEIRNKFLVGDIELIFSDIDLIQFSDCQKEWLQSLGFNLGIEIGYNQLDGYVHGLLENGGNVPYLWREKIPLIGIKDGINRTFYTPDKFINGSYFNNIFHLTVEHNGKELYESVDYSIAESGIPGSGYDTINIFSFTPNIHSLLYATYTIKV